MRQSLIPVNSSILSLQSKHSIPPGAETQRPYSQLQFSEKVIADFDVIRSNDHLVISICQRRCYWVVVVPRWLFGDDGLPRVSWELLFGQEFLSALQIGR